MDLPVFPLHSVLFPGHALGLHVFEERYRRMIDDVLPDGRFVVVAIRQGREVGGPADPYGVGVAVRPQVAERNEDGTVDLTVLAEERVRLLERSATDPYMRWLVEPYPEEGPGNPRVVAEALAAAVRFLHVAGVEGEVDVDPDPVTMSYALSAIVPGLVPDRQALLEIAGPAERLVALRDRFRLEAGLLTALRRRREP